MASKKETKQTEAIFMRINKQLKDKLQLLADKDNRYLSDFIRLHLEKLVK